MKKIIILLIAIVTLSSCTQQKIGYVNSSDLMKDYKAVKDLESEIKDKQTLLQGKYEQVALAFEKEVQEFQLKSKKQSRKKGEARYQELMYKQQQIQQSQQQESVALQKESQDKMDDLIDDIKDCLSRKQPVLVGTTSVEISELVVNNALKISNTVTNPAILPC